MKQQRIILMFVSVQSKQLTYLVSLLKSGRKQVVFTYKTLTTVIPEVPLTQPKHQCVKVTCV